LAGIFREYHRREIEYNRREIRNKEIERNKEIKGIK
jgi:hypothetical protein